MNSLQPWHCIHDICYHFLRRAVHAAGQCSNHTTSRAMLCCALCLHDLTQAKLACLHYACLSPLQMDPLGVCASPPQVPHMPVDAPAPSAMTQINLAQPNRVTHVAHSPKALPETLASHQSAGTSQEPLAPTSFKCASVRFNFLPANVATHQLATLGGTMLTRHGWRGPILAACIIMVSLSGMP